ncbi:MAG: hypothetical protein ACX939_13180 [Hyphococcus sp.]
MGEDRKPTIWQQGLVLSGQDSVTLGLITEEEKTEKIVIIATHDCDLLEPKDMEPVCEVLIGTKIDQINGTFSNAKNPRRLHLPFSGGTTSVIFELNARDKRTVDKDKILALQPDAEIRMLPTELWVLRSWLAARYFRPSYPDEFDRRLKAKPGEIHKKIANAIKGTGTDLVAVLFDIDAGAPDTDKPDSEVYSLSIFLVYDVSQDPARAEAAAKKAARTIRDVIRQRCLKDGKWQGIELRSCLPVSEDALTIYQMRMTKLWYFDSFEILFNKPRD